MDELDGTPTTVAGLELEEEDDLLVNPQDLNVTLSPEEKEVPEDEETPEEKEFTPRVEETPAPAAVTDEESEEKKKKKAKADKKAKEIADLLARDTQKKQKQEADAKARELRLQQRLAAKGETPEGAKSIAEIVKEKRKQNQEQLQKTEEAIAILQDKLGPGLAKKEASAEKPNKMVETAEATAATGSDRAGRNISYNMIQEQLRELENFTGDPNKISWDAFEYRFQNALDVAPNLDQKMKLSLLRQKLAGAPAELIRLDPKLQDQGFEELMTWLAHRYRPMSVPQKEQRQWMAGDTPDSYLVRIQKHIEADLPPLPPRRIIDRTPDTGDWVRDNNGEVVMKDNPDYKTMREKRETYRKDYDGRLRRDYLDGLKPSIARKIPDPPLNFEELHETVRRIYIHELKHPSIDDMVLTEKPQGGLPVFAAEAKPAQKTDKRAGERPITEMRKAMNNMKDLTTCLAKAMVQMTAQGSVKPTARAGTARDPEVNPTRNCFECGDPNHLVRDCPDRKKRLQKQGRNGSGNQMKGRQQGTSRVKFQKNQQFRQGGKRQGGQNQQQYNNGQRGQGRQRQGNGQRNGNGGQQRRFQQRSEGGRQGENPPKDGDSKQRERTNGDASNKIVGRKQDIIANVATILEQLNVGWESDDEAEDSKN